MLLICFRYMFLLSTLITSLLLITTSEQTNLVAGLPEFLHFVSATLYCFPVKKQSVSEQ